jgi:membrane associated rhomboid family serine protease
VIPIKDTVPRSGIPFATWAIIFLNGIIFLLEISIPKDTLEEIFYLFGLVPARYSYPKWAMVHGFSFDDYLSFLTNMFLHAGWLHIIGNMWFLYLFGRSVEERMGHLRFLVFYLISGIAASLTFFILDIHSTVPELGASGAIAGVMGAYLVLFPTARIIAVFPIFFFPFFFELPAFVYIGFWFLLQLFSGALSSGSLEAEGGVAWWAHVGGFVAGMVLLPLFKKRGHPSRKTYPDERYHHLFR